MLDSFFNLNFKTVDGTTRFFQYGVLSKGVIVTPEQQIQIKKLLRKQIFWWLLPMVLALPVVGLTMLMLLPAYMVWYSQNLSKIIPTPTSPDRISLIEHYERLGSILPIWLLWVLFITFVLITVLAGLALPRDLKVMATTGTIVGAAFIRSFFLIGASMMAAIIKFSLNERRRVVPPPLPVQT